MTTTPDDLDSEWWKHRRVQWPAAALLLTGAALTIALLRSNVSRIVVFNESGAALPELTVSACGQSQTFHEVADGDSVRFSLKGAGAESDITLSTNGTPIWHGEYVQPRGGYRAMIHLERGGQVDADVSVSWWRK